ncbi:MAG: acyloxyacyl hydrolase [Gemmatimonadaceae bacterium]|nr:acyloxyacyl hydrolase [Gemmatimonadaceae bacterium]
MTTLRFAHIAAVVRASLLLVLPVCTAAAEAQAVGGSTARATWQVGAYLGAARSSPGNGVLGTMPARDHVMLGLQAGTTVLRMGRVSINYIAQLLPLVVVSDRQAARFDADLDEAGLPRLPRRAYAFGVAPFGLELSTPAGRRVSAFLTSAGGGLIFSRAFPDVTGRRTNFTLEAGGGVRIRTGRDQWTQLGYKYHHLSNAGTAFANPGLDGNLVYAGYQWTARLPR